MVLSQGYGDAHLTVEFESRTACLDAERMVLTRKEYELLALLVRNAGDIVSRRSLLEIVWGYREGIRTRTLDVHIRRLRKKLGPYAGNYIETIFGVGYRFQPNRGLRLLGMPEVAMPLALPA